MQALATYKYLTTEQMVRLGLGSTRSHVIERVLKKLRPDLNKKHNPTALIDRRIFGAVIGKGALHDLYYLTDKGAAYVARQYDVSVVDLIYPNKSPQFLRDYFHRTAFVDVHLFLVNAAKRLKFRILRFDRYFDYFAKHQPSTRIALEDGSVIIPDGIIVVETNQGSRQLYFIEVHMGYRPKEVKRQLLAYQPLLNLKIAQQYFGQIDEVSVLSIYEQSKCLIAVKNALSNVSEKVQFVDYTDVLTQDLTQTSS